MSASYRILEATERAASEGQHQFATEILTGLSQSPKRVPSRWFYDDVGSALFREICALDAYYPTRCETEILTKYGDRILDLAEAPSMNLVDLGAGDGRKTALLLERARARGIDLTYVPIDISESAMNRLVNDTRTRFEGLAVQGIVSEYFDGLHWLSRLSGRRNLVLFLGSNIGNFGFAPARDFLRLLWNALNPGDLLLVGFDLKKDIEVLLRAYNDPEGVTAAFNLNLFVRINRELDADFDLSGFRHFGTYDVLSGAMESYLVSQKAQSVSVGALHRRFDFEPWEAVHTEYSYKYLESDIASLADDTDFEPIAKLHDSRHWFANCLWRVQKPLAHLAVV